MVVRVVVVLVLWLGVYAPLGRALFRRFRRREQAAYGADVARALEQLPGLRQIAARRGGSAATPRDSAAGKRFSRGTDPVGAGGRSRRSGGMTW